MAGVKKITQLHRVVFRSKESADADWEVFELGVADLGQDTVASYNIAPRIMDVETQAGTTHEPIAGTYDDFSASITFLPTVWRIIGKALRNWNAATFTGATDDNGNIVGAASVNPCATSSAPVSVILQGICDDGSTADVEFARCYPSIDGEIEVGASSTPEVTLALNPQIYNPTTMASDGYEAYDYRMGDHSLTANERLNAATGEYETVTTA